ncbi:uncharacterized protein LY79DRAFT_675126 [Colletotrichum navitas]|uniref:Malonyl-CoA:ACP transacylase (MAT) domain-containing protein n=1 Tax=Colletotrichum navitas TaxID=681940 RepID=A0AAD8PJI7_9PEZI|nr:uncharacterized protein LY79DRAFT_675126 [Colletotrichum navitas]KAK1565843.1 hypothetical protein LY79DRAFT_675126 [Colletotrichum navitas]
MCTAGVLSVANTLFLVGKQAEFMMTACEPGSHAMMSIRGASAQHIAHLCRGSETKFRYEVSCINGRQDTVASLSLKCMLLDVTFAFHLAQRDSILDDFETAARRATFKASKIPVLSSLLVETVANRQITNATYMRRATREPVDFESTIRASETKGLIDNKTVWVDIGPHPMCDSFQYLGGLGWESEPLKTSPNVVYYNYVCMLPVDGQTGAYIGNIYLLRGVKIMGAYVGIKFKRISRALMTVMFPQQNAIKGGRPPGHRQADVFSGLNNAKLFSAITAIPRRQYLMLIKEPSAAPVLAKSSPLKTQDAKQRLPRMTTDI